MSGRTLAIPKVKHKHHRHHNNSNPKIAEKLGFNPFTRFGSGRKKRKQRDAKVYADEGPVSSALSDLESVKWEKSGNAGGGRRMSMAELKEFVDGRVSAEAKGAHRKSSVHGAGLVYTPAKSKLSEGKQIEEGIEPQLSSHYRKETMTMDVYSEAIKAQVSNRHGGFHASKLGGNAVIFGELGISGLHSEASSWSTYPVANAQSTKNSIDGEAVPKMRSMTLHKGGHNVASGQQMKLQVRERGCEDRTA